MSDLWYVETALYDQQNELMEDVGCVLVSAKNGWEASRKAEKLVIERRGVQDAEGAIAEPIEQEQVDELMGEIAGLIVEPGLDADPPSCQEN